MANTYYVDFNGQADDSGDGLSKEAAFKHDPDMDVFAGTCPLADGDTILYINTRDKWDLPDSAGVKFRTGVHNITRMTDPDEPVKALLDYKITPPDAWVDQGSNVWKLTLGSTQYAIRFFIAEQPLRHALSVLSMSAERPFYSEDNSGEVYLYSLFDPFTLYGADMGFVRGNGPTTGFYFDENKPSNGHTVKDIRVMGAAVPIYIRGNHHRITIDGCEALQWGRHGVRSIGNAVPSAGTDGIPNRYIEFLNCRADMNTRVDEFPIENGERDGSSFSMIGPHYGGGMEHCFAQDSPHTAFVIQAQNTFIDGVEGYKFGVTGWRMRYCTGDNSNSFYGRLLGTAGRFGAGPYDFPSSYGVISHCSGTNFQTRSQVAGRYIWIYSNNFSGVLGSLAADGGTVPDPVRGEGLTLASSDVTTFGTKELVGIWVFNNVFSNNQNPGLYIKYGAASGDGGNRIFNNIIANNNPMADPEEVEIINVQLFINGPIPTGDVYTENCIGGPEIRGGAGLVRAVVHQDGDYTYMDVDGFNAARGLNTLNTGDRAVIDMIAYDGRPVTGAAVASYGTLPTPITAPNLLEPAGDENNFLSYIDRPASNWMRGAIDVNVINDEFGVQIDAELNQLHNNVPFNGSGGVDVTVSFLIAARPEAVFVDANPGEYDVVVNDGVTSQTDTGVSLLQSGMAQHSFTVTLDPLATNNGIFLRAREGFVYPDFHIDLAYFRVALESTAPLPLQPLYDQVDPDGVFPAKSHIGAYAVPDLPYAPNVVADAFGNPYNTSSAVIRLAQSFYTLGTVTAGQSDTVAEGNVISQSIEPGTQHAVGTAVDLVIATTEPITSSWLTETHESNEVVIYKI